MRCISCMHSCKQKMVGSGDTDQNETNNLQSKIYFIVSKQSEKLTIFLKDYFAFKIHSTPNNEMNIYQTNFIKNSSISLKQKRLRHINLVNGKNLKINSNRFNIWFTLHASKTARAFYISDKKENDRNPKWLLLNLSKSPYKEFFIRIWYTNLDENLLHKKTPDHHDRLHMLLDMHINLDSLIQLNDDIYNYSLKNIENLLVFEVFGLKFTVHEETQPLPSNLKAIRSMPNLATSHSKKSYPLNLMNRLHDFQRVMHETSLKIAQLKQNSLSKFDPSSRIRQLQVQREHKLQRIKFLKENLDQLTQSITHLEACNADLQENAASRNRKLLAFKQNLDADKEKFAKLEINIKLLLKENYIFENKLKKRQRQLVAELAKVFVIAKSGDFMKILNANLKLNNPQSSLQTNNLIILNLDDIKENSIAFGYIIQAVQLLSAILSVPLRYPIIFRASRSFIIEQFNDNDGNSREYPFFDATHDETLSLAISLLNKNVSQLRLLFDSYRNFDHNETLINLKWIFDYFLN